MVRVGELAATYDDYRGMTDLTYAPEEVHEDPLKRRTKTPGNWDKINTVGDIPRK